MLRRRDRDRFLHISVTIQHLFKNNLETSVLAGDPQESKDSKISVDGCGGLTRMDPIISHM